MIRYIVPALLWAFSIGGCLSLAAQEPGSGGLKVEHHNEIVQVYLAPGPKEGPRTLVFEMKTMTFLQNQSLYGRIFVNGRIVQIREYNTEDSYVRGELALLPDEPEITAYSGVLSSAPADMDFFNYPPMWKAFAESEFKPFVAKVSELPEWYVSNPIRDRKRKE